MSVTLHGLLMGFEVNMRNDVILVFSEDLNFF